MAQAQSGDTVKVHYTGKLNDGTVFDSSEGREPLSFTLGSQQVIPGFEEAVIGMATGESATIEIPSDKAYGPRQDQMIVKVERSQMPADLNPQIDQKLQVQQPDGNTMVVTVVEMDEQSVTLDANHPLAGKDLTFDIQLVEIG